MVTLDFKRVAFDVTVMVKIRRITAKMIVMFVTQATRMPSATTPHDGVRDVLVELVYVLFQL